MKTIEIIYFIIIQLDKQQKRWYIGKKGKRGSEEKWSITSIRSSIWKKNSIQDRYWWELSCLLFFLFLSELFLPELIMKMFISHSLFLTAFVAFRIGFLILSIFLINREFGYFNNIYAFTQFKIFLFSVFLFMFDYSITFLKNLRDIIFLKSGDIKLISLFSIIISIIIILTLINTSNPQDFIKSSAIIILFLIVKYSSKAKVRYYLW